MCYLHSEPWIKLIDLSILKYHFLALGQRENGKRSKNETGRDGILMADPVPPRNKLGQDFDSQSRPVPRQDIGQKQKKKKKDECVKTRLDPFRSLTCLHQVCRFLIQAFLDFFGFDFCGFRFTAVYNSILFSSPLVLLSNLDLRGFCFRGFSFVSPH